MPRGDIVGGGRRRVGGGVDFRRRKWWWKMMNAITDSSSRLWLLFATFLFLLLLLYLCSPPSRSFDNTPPSLISQKPYRARSITEDLNVTEEMLNPYSISRQLVDQISLAKTFVVIAKENKNLQFAWELSEQIRNSQSTLSKVATRRAPLSSDASKTAIRGMAVLLYQAQQFHYDGASMLMRLKGQIHALEDKANTEKEKSTRYGQIAAEEVPKGLHCLSTRLTMEWFKNPNLSQKEKTNGRLMKEKIKDNTLYHFCVFSDNVLAVSAVVNSTASNSNDPNRIVFHLVTDEINYISMRAWFSMNNFNGVTVEVQKIEDFSWLNASYVPVLKQLQDTNTQNFYFSGNANGQIPVKFRNPKYLSLLNHLRFYLPEVYPALEKMVFLDDDVIVQKDLSQLFSIDLNGNVMGAVETCMETFHRFHKYLNCSHPLLRAHFDPDACGWAFGMNVFDLKEWRKRDVTGIYHYWQEQNADHTLWKLGSLPPGLLAFYGLVETLDPKWHVLGLGYSTVDSATIRNGAVVHWNGNQKPWLKIANEKYKVIWDKYVEYSHPFLQSCNIL